MKLLDNCIEDNPILLPVLKHGVSRIGDLWDCHTSANVGENLFTENLDGDYVRASPIESLDFKLIHSRSISDEMKTVKIGGEISLELLGGLIAVKGGADYKNDEKKSAKSEKLICYYERETYSIFAEHSAKNVMNQEIVEKIMNKEIKATHLVRSVILGAELRADIEISTKDKKSFSDISGNLFGKLTYGPVSASIKVSLGFLDSEENSHLKKEITVHTKPAVKIQPTTIEQMFTMIDSFSDVVQDEKHFPKSGEKVVGVPIKFILVPIKVFLTFNVERLYIKMKENAMDQFREMLEKIHDYQSPDYISRLVLDKIPELSIILNDELSSLSTEIRDYEKKLKEICKEYFEKSTNAFRDYKVGKIRVEALLSIRNEFESKCNSSDIQEKIIFFGKDGEEQLRSVHSVDIQDSKQFVTILTNEHQLNNFTNGDKEIKILLYTDHDSPEGVFVKFYDMAKPLNNLGCRLAVAVQAISPKFQLSVKANGREQIYDEKNELPSILSVIAATVGVGCENDLLFHSLNAEILNTKLPYKTEEELKDINNFILNSKINNSKCLTIAKSKQETFECLTRTDGKLKFFIPLDIAHSSFLAIRYLPVLLSKVQSENINWVVGNLNVNLEEESGLLFLIKNMKVLAVCLDIYDLELLREKFDEENLDILNILSPQEMSFSFFPKRVESSLKMIKIIESYEYKLINISSLGMESFDEPEDEEVSNALQLVMSWNSKLPLNFLGTLAKFALREHKELEKGLLAGGYSTTSRHFKNNFLSEESKMQIKRAVNEIMQYSDPLGAKINITLAVLNQFVNEEEKQVDLLTSVNNAIESLLNDKKCPDALRTEIEDFEGIELKTKCIQVIRILEKYEEENGNNCDFQLKSFLSILNNEQEQNVHNVLLSYINKINLDVTVFEAVNARLIEELKKKHFFTLIMYLSEISKGVKYMIIQKGFENICGCAEKDKVFALDQLLTKLCDRNYFGEKQWEDLWNNNRFIYLIESYIKEHRIASKLLLMGCEASIPNYIPKDIAAKINATRIITTEISLPEVINDFDHFVQVLKEMRRADNIPEKFKTILAHSITNNQELRKHLDEFLITSKWEWNGNIFSKAIEMSSIEVIVDEINDSKRKEKELQLQNPLPEIEFNIQFADKTDHKIPEMEIKNEIDDWSMPEELLNVFGKKVGTIQSSDFLTLKKILARPTIDSSCKPIASQVVPYIMQKIKMWGCSVLKADNISLMMPERLHEGPTTAITNRPRFRRATIPNKEIEEKNKNPDETLLSRLDAIVAIFNNVDSIVGQDLLTVIAKFPIAIPLIVKNIYKEDKFKVLIPWLTEPTIKWESNPGKIIENNLFIDKFKVIVALRIGDVKPGKCGKSTLLNQLFSIKNLFSSCGEPGAKYNKPVTLKGTAEMIWLTQEVSTNSLWESSLAEHYKSGENELILLVNLHGNALDLPDHLNFLKTIASAYLLFVMREGISDLQSEFEKIEQMLSLEPESDKLGYIAVDPIEASDHDEELTIETSNIHDDANIAKLRAVLKHLIGQKGIECGIRDLTNVGTVKMTEFIETELSNQLIIFIQNVSCQKVKNAMCLQRVTGDYVMRECSLIWKDNNFLNHIITMMGNVLKLEINSRQKAIVQLERKLGIISAKESAKIRMEYKKAQHEYQKKIAKSDDKVALNYWKAKINETLEKMDNMSLGLEHFFREIGKLYEMSLLKTPLRNSYSELAKSYAELLISGQALELLDGDSSSITASWFSAICQNVDAIMPKLKIFVISILGLQSSGKSTLLNSLFACKFAASVGRCTRGLFMRLVFLDKEMKEQLDLSFDAVLLIDTEGLGAPEKQNEESSEKKDRIMATFAMGISHLTIINVLGEYVNNLTEILQIAIVSMARLEKVEISPDILMVQHLTERNSDKMTSATKQFSDALETAINIADQKDMSLGIRNSNCLKKLTNTIEQGKLFRQFRPFKNGASAYSPPSEEYHEDVVNLYESIFETARASGANYSFTYWADMINIYWNSIKDENFMRFRDVKELQGFLKTSDQIFKVKDSIESAFKEHSEQMTSYLNESAIKINKNEMKSEHAHDHLTKTFNRIPSPCPFDQPCDHCVNFLKVQGELYSDVNGKPNEHDVTATIQKYIKNVRDDYIKHLSQKLSAVAFRQIESEENFSKIEKRLKVLLQNKAQFNEAAIQTITNEIWNELERDASEKVKESPVIEKIMLEITQVYSENPQVLEDVRKYKCTSLENIPAFNLNWVDRNIKKNIKFKVNEFLGSAQTFELEGILNSLPMEITKQEKVDTYRKGMVKKLDLHINALLKKLALKVNNKLIDSFKWKVANFAIVAFTNYMVEKQRKWNLENHPLVILQNNKAKYYKWIGDKLRYGFGYYSDGFEAGVNLLRAIVQKSLKIANDKKFQDFKSQPWVSSSAKIRLKYLSELVEEVKVNQFENALSFFKEPQKCITKWYQNRLESTRSVDEYIFAFNESLKKLFTQVFNKINELSTIEEKQNYIRDFFSQCDGIEARFSTFAGSATKEDAKIFSNGIIDAFEQEKAQMFLSDEIKLQDLTQDSMLVSKLGCTKACHYCSALCWMPYGHESDIGNSKKHHTCHQPYGLNGIHYHGSNELNVDPCHSQHHNNWHWVVNGNSMHFNTMIANNGIVNEWKFEGHTETHFNQLMLWFFFKLQKEIAKRKGVNPAKENEMKYYNMELLGQRIDSIMISVQDSVNRKN